MTEETKKPCKCPYCDTEIKDKESEECGFCKVKINHCKACSYPISDHIKECPNCGAKL